MGDLAQTTNDNNEETKGTPFEIWSLLVLFQSRLLLVFQFSDMGLFLFLFLFLFFFLFFSEENKQEQDSKLEFSEDEVSLIAKMFRLVGERFVSYCHSCHSIYTQLGCLILNYVCVFCSFWMWQYVLGGDQLLDL